MRAIAGLLALVLLGCANPAADNHGYGWHYDFETASGVRVRYDPGTLAGSATPSYFETAYRETAACLHVSPVPPGPLIVIVPPMALPLDHGGQTFLDTGLILISDPWLQYELSLLAVPGRTVQSRLRHEIVHYLLIHLGASAAVQWAHDHPAFTTCTVFTS
jgi:hypothetical protein